MSFGEGLESALARHLPYACLFRGYERYGEYLSLARCFVDLCHKFSALSLVSGDLALARHIPFDGVHLKGHQREQIARARAEKECVFYSAHSLEDMLLADQEGVRAMTISPIFDTPNKPVTLGVSWLRETLESHHFKAEIFALGGVICAKHIQALAESRVHGFASIRYFVAQRSK